ncbi:Calx-beta domain-containing protein [Myxococcaceae bacterium GXIMD 01537]
MSFAEAASSVSEAAARATPSLRITTTDGRATRCPVVVSFATLDGSASASADYGYRYDTFLVRAGTASGSTRRLSIPLQDDALDEDDERLSVVITSLAGAVEGATPSHVLTLLDDDPSPALSTRNRPHLEG